MGKTTLSLHPYEMAEEFDLKMWVCVFTNFEAKKRKVSYCDTRIIRLGQHDIMTILRLSYSECGSHWVSFHHLLIKEKLWRIPEKECFRIQGENELFYRVPETIRHLAINANNLEVVGETEK
ncbi:hypothetical protein IEQ34_021119 [Dendrobium chrysotoxum]|uniref:Uncharacterized protein n=1 Tax=Dendrobium chrysotoxum TaxID=161865 RepID=A0AAV7G3Y6_DENCH|nr:hypothetical protein IEQ34_021119 [Dendrobium chrysotoxum]